MHPAGPPHSRSRGGASGFVAVLLLALALAHIRYLWFVCDDAYITFRYASNLAHGLGPVWNAGERVEGYTNSLWMLLAAAVTLCGGKPEVVMPALGAACALATLAAIGIGLRRRGSAGAYAVGLLVLVGVGALLARRARRGWLAPPALGLWIALAIVIVAPQLVWRLSFYGRWLPNTAVVKAPGAGLLGAGAAYVADAFATQHLW